MMPEIRKTLEELGQATADELAERLQVQTFAGLKQLRDALGELVKRGSVAREERPALYRLVDQDRGRYVKQDNIWRAIQVEPHGFTYKKIMLLAGSCHDYTRRYLKWLEKKGIILRAGVRGVQNGVFRPEVVYKVAPGKERLGTPLWARVKEEGRK